MQSKIISYPLDTYAPKPDSVLVGGCFDLLHYGHLTFLKSAKAAGKTLIVGLESDESIRRGKGNNPIHTQQQRAEILAELGCVDLVITLPPLTNYDDYLQLVTTLSPSILAITEGDPQTENKRKQAATIGAKVVIVNTLIEGISSQIIRNRHL